MPDPPSLDLRRLDLRRDESRGTCCGDVSADEPEFGLSMSALPRWLARGGAADPVLDITAATARLPRFGAASASAAAGAVSGSVSGSVVSGCWLPRGRLVLRCSRAIGGVESAGAFRLRGAGVARVDGVSRAAAEGDCWAMAAANEVSL